MVTFDYQNSRSRRYLAMVFFSHFHKFQFLLPTRRFRGFGEVFSVTRSVNERHKQQHRNLQRWTKKTTNFFGLPIFSWRQHLARTKSLKFYEISPMLSAYSRQVYSWYFSGKGTYRNVSSDDGGWITQLMSTWSALSVVFSTCPKLSDGFIFGVVIPRVREGGGGNLLHLQIDGRQQIHDVGKIL